MSRLYYLSSRKGPCWSAHRSGQGCAPGAHREAAVAFSARMRTPEWNWRKCDAPFPVHFLLIGMGVRGGWHWRSPRPFSARSRQAAEFASSNVVPERKRRSSGENFPNHIRKLQGDRNSVGIRASVVVELRQRENIGKNGINLGPPLSDFHGERVRNLHSWVSWSGINHESTSMHSVHA